MEDQRQWSFTKSIARNDGLKVNVQVKMKYQTCKMRKVKSWTLEEDKLLIALYQEHPKKWATIASLMKDRNQNQCLHRFRRIGQNGSNRKIWSPEEDEEIKKMMKKVGKNWKLLSEMIGTKTGKQIRERFINKLDPKIKKQDWSEEQDRKIIELYCLIGRKWSEISKQLPGRPQNKIKNRFYSYIQKNYDIKCRSINEEKELQNEKTEKEEKRVEKKDKKEERASFRDVFNLMQRNVDSIKETFKDERSAHFILPSMNQLDFEMKMDDYCDQNMGKTGKNVIGSMRKIEQQWAEVKEKDCYNFGVNTEFQTDFFYLSGN